MEALLVRPYEFLWDLIAVGSAITLHALGSMHCVITLLLLIILRHG